jgi:hypothetical protein
MIGNAQRPHRIGTVFTARPLQLFTRRQTATKAMRRVEHVQEFLQNIGHNGGNNTRLQHRPRWLTRRGRYPPARGSR